MGTTKRLRKQAKKAWRVLEAIALNKTDKRSLRAIKRAAARAR